MKRHAIQFSIAVFFAAILIAGTAHFIGHKRTTMGPRPSAYPMLDAGTQRSVDQLRTWINTLSPQDAKTLSGTGHLVYTYADLQKSDPVHAQLMDQVVEANRIRFWNGWQTQLHKMTPEQRVYTTAVLGSHHDPDRIEIVCGKALANYRFVPNQGPGKYLVAISYKTSRGVHHDYFTVSDAS